MVEGIELTSEPWVQKRPIDWLVREAILSGTYEPGARIRETELAERFSVSRSPAREALQTLEKKGALEGRE